MKREADLIRARLKTPRAAAIAGIQFSVLLIAVLLLFRLSVRADPLEAGAWLKTSSNTIALALNLVPFAGIAFLWFIGVLRDRLGELEDRFEMARVREQDMNAKTKTMLDLDNPTLDWVQMSTSLGVPATRAATAEEFHREFEAALAAKGPRLIECQVAIAKEMVALTEYIHKMR